MPRTNCYLKFSQTSSISSETGSATRPGAKAAIPIPNHINISTTKNFIRDSDVNPISLVKSAPSCYLRTALPQETVPRGAIKPLIFQGGPMPGTTPELKSPFFNHQYNTTKLQSELMVETTVTQKQAIGGLSVYARVPSKLPNTVSDINYDITTGDIREIIRKENMPSPRTLLPDNLIMQPWENNLTCIRTDRMPGVVGENAKVSLWKYMSRYVYIFIYAYMHIYIYIYLYIYMYIYL